MYWMAAVSLHVLAAVAWIGGMVFLAAVLVPLVRTAPETSEQIALFRLAARRFRIVVWLSILALLATGPVLLHARNVLFTVPNDWPAILQLKMALVLLLLFLTGAHDLVLAQRVKSIRGTSSFARTTSNGALITTARWVPRLALLVGVFVLLAAIVLART
jgi:uncharacterized membrane protein